MAQIPAEHMKNPEVLENILQPVWTIKIVGIAGDTPKVA